MFTAALSEDIKQIQRPDEGISKEKKKYKLEKKSPCAALGAGAGQTRL